MYTGNLIGGRYRLVRRIGAGNMGVVFEVEDQETGRKVALKQVLYGSPEHNQRLLREARVCERLKHPNIIEVLDVGVTDTGAPFLVMPLLIGETIAELLKRKRRVAPALVAQVGRDIASALAAAHAEGVIHRDLKPANVFIHRPGKAEKPTIKVLDFGVCKDVNSKLTVLTSAGNVIGTPAYMSPEQLKGAELDPRTDVWSLGIVLFEMLTGVRPFRGEGVELFLKILNGEIPTVSQLVRSMPPGLADVVSRCLTRERSARAGSAEEVAAQLDEITRGDVPVSTAMPLPEPGGSTSSGLATHLGSQTVTGSALVEAGAAMLALASPPSALSSPPAPRRALGDTLMSASAPESPASDVLLDSSNGVEVVAAGQVDAPGDLVTSLESDDASSRSAYGSSFNESELPSVPGFEHAGAMTLDSEVLDGMSHRVVLAIGAAALAFALVAVGLYAAVAGVAEPAVAQTAGLSAMPVPVIPPPSAPVGAGEEQPTVAPPPSSSPLEPKATSESPNAKPKARIVAASVVSTARLPPRSLPATKPMTTPAQPPLSSTSKPQVSPRPTSPVKGTAAATTSAQSAKLPAKSKQACGGKVIARCVPF